MPDVRRGKDRYLTTGDGTSTRHSFSYGIHYDPANIGFGEIIAINEEYADPGQGYELHHHANVEIVTWVLEGELLHEDSSGHGGVIVPGLAQRLSAGDGVQHSERNASQTEPLRFLQMMLRSDNTGEPSYEQSDTGAISVHNARARLLTVRCGPGEMVHVPSAPLSYAHVTRGQVSAAEHFLTAGDALRLTDAGAYDVFAQERAEVLIWQMQR